MLLLISFTLMVRLVCVMLSMVMVWRPVRFLKPNRSNNETQFKFWYKMKRKLLLMLNRISNSTSPALRAGMKQVRRNQSFIAAPIAIGVARFKKCICSSVRLLHNKFYCFIKIFTFYHQSINTGSRF